MYSTNLFLRFLFIFSRDNQSRRAVEEVLRLLAEKHGNILQLNFFNTLILFMALKPDTVQPQYNHFRAKGLAKLVCYNAVS